MYTKIEPFHRSINVGVASSRGQSIMTNTGTSHELRAANCELRTAKNEPSTLPRRPAFAPFAPGRFVGLLKSCAFDLHIQICHIRSVRYRGPFVAILWPLLSPSLRSRVNSCRLPPYCALHSYWGKKRSECAACRQLKSDGPGVHKSRNTKIMTEQRPGPIRTHRFLLFLISLF